MLLSCHDDVIMQEMPTVAEEGGQVTLTVGLKIPELQAANSRALGEFQFTEEYVKSLPLQLVVFDEGGVLTEYKDSRSTDSDKKVEITTVSATDKLVTFKVKLTVTNSKRYVHFILNSPTEAYDWGTESNLIGSLSVNNQTPAYWQRVEFPNGIAATMNTDGKYTATDEVVGLMTKVPMLRNFAKISVATTTAAAEILKDVEYYVVNVWDAGTVAPYYNGEFTDFLSFSDATSAPSKYMQITGRGYEGIEPSGAKLIQKGPDPKTDNEETWTVDDDDWIEAGAKTTDGTTGGSPFYMYERRNTFVSVNVPSTFLLIRGKYNGSEEYSYYKLDLVYTKDQTTLQKEYYNILRNFHYAVTIESVSGAGYDNPFDAATHAASNNLSGSIDLRDLTNISDKQDRLFVSYTDMTIVNSGTLTAEREIQYKYVKGLSTDTKTNDNVVLRELTEKDSDKRITGIYYYKKNDTRKHHIYSNTQEGGYDWIDNYAGQPDIAITNDGWSSIYVEFGGTPSNIVLTNTLGFYIGALGREVDYHLRSIMPMIVECRPSKVPEGVKQSVAGNILIPAGITDANDAYQLFPLEFWVEAEQLTLSPDVVSNKAAITLSPYEMPVESGNSIIPSKANKQTYRYKRTITNEEYQQLPTKPVTVTKELDGTTDLATSITETYKIIPCHFLTNTIESESKVYAKNDYFNLIKYGEFKNADPDIKNATLTDYGVYGIGQAATLSFTAVTGDTYTITSDNLSEPSRSVSKTVSLKANGSTEINLVTATWEKTSMVTITASDGTEYDVMAAARKSLPMKATTKFVSNEGESELTGNPTLYVYSNMADALALADNKVADVTNTALTTDGTSKVIEGLKESTELWFAYKTDDYVYVASTTAGALEAGNAELIFSDENRAVIPLEMSVAFENGTQYYGIGKTFAMTFETNKPGTYKLASNNTLTFTLNDVVVTEFTVTAAGTYTFTCTTTTWSTKASVTITPVSPLTGEPVSDEGEERTWLQIGKLSCSNNSPDPNTTVYLRNSDDENIGNWTWSQITNGNAEVEIKNLGQDDSGYYFRYSIRGMWTTNYNSQQLNAAQINDDTAIRFTVVR